MNICSVNLTQQSVYLSRISLIVSMFFSLCGINAQEVTMFEIENQIAVKKSSFNLTRLEFSDNRQNTFIGLRAGRDSEFVNHNTFIGSQSGIRNQLGISNTFLGSETGSFNVEGSGNTFLGAYTGQDNTDSGNTYIGFSAGKNIDSGEDNTIIGRDAGSETTDGSRNVFIGAFAGDHSSSSTGNIMIGYSAGSLETEDSKLYIENGSSMDPLIYGDFDQNEMTIHGQLGINIKQPDSELHIYHAATNGGGSTGLRLENSGVNNNWWNFYTVNSSGNLILFSKAGGSSSVGAFDDVSGVYTPTADMRFKKNIEILSDVIKDVKKVSIKKYQFKSQEDTGKKYVGVLAQQIIDLFPEVVHYDEEYDKYRVDYSSLSVLALKAIQEQQEQIELLIKNQKYMQDQIDKINQN